MLIYLISLPIWNFVLPTYAYWHFDDFSWGDTRKVEGVKKDTGHGDESGKFDSSVITMKKWSEYEVERRTKLARERNLPTPRFVERHLSVDIFRENNGINNSRRYSNLSNESGGNIPLTQMDYGVANHNAYHVTGGPSTSSSSPLGIIPSSTPYQGIELSDDNNETPEESIHNNKDEQLEIENILKSVQNDDLDQQGGEGESHELGWIQQSTHDNNWADPAPHHAVTAFEDDRKDKSSHLP
jgi:chitin synthase